MKFRTYLSAKAITLCFLFLGSLLTGSVLLFANVNSSLIILLESLFFCLVFGWMAVGYLSERSKLERLEKIIQELPDSYLLGEVLPAPTNAVERRYYRIMKTVSCSAVGLAEQVGREKEEYCDYVESWIHEMKTPLTACSLILANDGDICKLKRELKRADNLTETILYYAKLRTVEKDTQIRKFQVATVIERAIKSQMELLIAAKIAVETKGDFIVYSDSNALCFILKQFLVNCAKYCPGCQICIYADKGKITVEDNGIGIPSHELRRVTERGFTGSNGRKTGGSTGMGLYIVQELCNRLEISMKIEAVQNAFTRITLSFDNLTKL